MPTSEATPVIIRYIHPLHHGHTKVTLIVMNEWLTSISCHVNRPSHSWNETISNFDLETSGLRSWVRSKGKDHIVHPVYKWFASSSFHINQTNNSWDNTSEIWPWNIHGQGHGRGQNQCQIIHAVSNFWNPLKKTFPTIFLQDLIQ